jgi:hypothetical protein
MNTIVNLVMRIAGFGKAVEALDGETSKTYAAGVGQILTGAAGILGGLGMYATQFIGAKGGAEYLGIVQGALHNPATAAIGFGWSEILKGRATIAQRHALAKAVSESKDAPVESPKPLP